MRKLIPVLAISIGASSIATYFAYNAYLSPLANTCREVAGNPIHLMPIVGPAVYGAFPKEMQTPDQHDTIAMSIMTYCQFGADQTMRQIADDIVQSRNLSKP